MLKKRLHYHLDSNTEAAAPSAGIARTDSASPGALRTSAARKERASLNIDMIHFVLSRVF
jgi:hypothetical protein